MAAAEVVFPKGSAIGLRPPKGMSLAGQFSGFEDSAAGISILLNAFPPQAYAEVAAGFSDDARLARQGIVAQKRENLRVDDSPALLIMGQQEHAADSLRKWILLIGSPACTAVITVQYPDSAAAAYPDSAIRAALTSATVRKPPPSSEQVAALPYTISTVGKFRALQVLAGNTVALTDGHRDADPDHKQASFLATVTDVVPPAESREAFAQKQFAEMRALQQMTPKSSKSITINGLPGHEVAGTARSQSGVKLKVVQWTIFAPSATLHLLANARPAHFDRVFPEFIKLRDSVRLK
jgi:hypothetical protein